MDFERRRPGERDSAADHPLDPGAVGIVDDGVLAEIPLTLLGLFRQDVTAERLLALHFACGRDFETLLGAAGGFHLGHNYLTSNVIYRRKGHWPARSCS